VGKCGKRLGFFEGSSGGDGVAGVQAVNFFDSYHISSHCVACILSLFFENLIGICETTDILLEPMAFGSGGGGVAGIQAVRFS